MNTPDKYLQEKQAKQTNKTKRNIILTYDVNREYINNYVHLRYLGNV